MLMNGPLFDCYKHPNNTINLSDRETSVLPMKVNQKACRSYTDIYTITECRIFCRERERSGGIGCYVGTFTTDYPNDNLVLFLTDVFGIQASYLLVDSKVRQKRIQIFGSVSKIPHRAMSFDAQITEQTRPTLDTVVNELKYEGIMTFADSINLAAGPYVFDLALDHIMSVSVTAHTSLLNIPKDLEIFSIIQKCPATAKRLLLATATPYILSLLFKNGRWRMTT
ncbi:hypothetical protein BDQ12DRAFT_665311 [Crucibulum laeve]|uniref:Uncharacterized protein n=1 Tax=Crucibulum laeve TaxID=68775 RepID=A0A5C3M6J2_9AGAR|nr:hypothetical protein BDQ12DRAFT_665311 [Crucibulum laeve]